MAYAQPTDMVSRFSQATMNQLLPVAGTNPPSFDTTRAAVILAAVSNFMDSYIGMRFTLPLNLNPIPSQIVDACCDIAYYRMYAARPLGTIDDARLRYEDAIRYLKDLANSNATLGTTPAQEVTLAQAATVQSSAPPRNLAMNSNNPTNPIQQFMGFPMGSAGQG